MVQLMRHVNSLQFRRRIDDFCTASEGLQALDTEQNLHVTQRRPGKPHGAATRTRPLHSNGAITYLPDRAQLEADEGGAWEVCWSGEFSQQAERPFSSRSAAPVFEAHQQLANEQ